MYGWFGNKKKFSHKAAYRGKAAIKEKKADSPRGTEYAEIFYFKLSLGVLGVSAVNQPNPS
jgi:hypothetical protein